MGERNRVIIADKDIKVYAWDCLLLFRRFDQIILSTSEPYKERTNYLIDTLKGVGVVVDKKYKNNSDKIMYKTIKKEIIDDKGRTRDRIFFEVILTKIPDLFMFTDPDYEEPKSVEEIDG